MSCDGSAGVAGLLGPEPGFGLISCDWVLVEPGLEDGELREVRDEKEPKREISVFRKSSEVAYFAGSGVASKISLSSWTVF